MYASYNMITNFSFSQCSQNPLSIAKYQNDKEVREILFVLFILRTFDGRSLVLSV